MKTTNSPRAACAPRLRAAPLPEWGSCSGKFLGEPDDLLARIIGAAVVDQDHLEWAEHPQGGEGLLDVGRDLRALVMEGHDDGENDGRGGAHGCLRPQRTTPTKSTIINETRPLPNI
jgi:hypothetical protein